LIAAFAVLPLLLFLGQDVVLGNGHGLPQDNLVHVDDEILSCRPEYPQEIENCFVDPIETGNPFLQVERVFRQHYAHGQSDPEPLNPVGMIVLASLDRVTPIISVVLAGV
jgi:hypothetical protein